MVLRILLVLMMIFFIIKSFVIDSQAASVMHQILGSLSMVKAIMIGMILCLLEKKKKEK